MTDHVDAIQRASLDRALAADDPSVARRHLALVAAVDSIRGTPGAADRLATAAATTVAVRAMTEPGSDAVPTPAPPTPASPPGPRSRPGGIAGLAVDGVAVAHRRLDASIDRLAARADVSTAAVRAALARR